VVAVPPSVDAPVGPSPGPIHAAIDAPALAVEATIDAVTLLIQAPVDDISFSVQLARQQGMACRSGPVGLAVETMVDDITFVVQAMIDAVAFYIQPVLDHVTATVEPMLDPVAKILAEAVTPDQRTEHQNHRCRHMSCDHHVPPACFQAPDILLSGGITRPVETG